MDHVRDHPSGDHRLESLAKIAHASPFHFHRIFRTIAGETLAAFSRRARLERAAYLMKARPERTLSAIALETGFPSHSEFTRAFKRLHGIAPSQWDRTSRLRHLPDDDGTEVPRWDAPAEPPTARVVARDAQRLAYVRMRTWFDVAVLKDGFAELTAWFDRQGIDWTALPLVGMSWDNYETTPLERVQYDLAFAVPEGVSASGPVALYTLPAFHAVEVHCQGELSAVGQAWDYLYEEWFPTSDWEPADLPAMKRFRSRPDELGWSSWDLDCSIPIRPAQP